MISIQRIEQNETPAQIKHVCVNLNTSIDVDFVLLSLKKEQIISASMTLPGTIETYTCGEIKEKIKESLSEVISE